MQVKKIIFYFVFIPTVYLIGLLSLVSRLETKYAKPAENINIAEVNGPSSEVEEEMNLDKEAGIDNKKVKRFLTYKDYAQKLDEMNLKISKTGDNWTANNEVRCKALIYRSLLLIPNDKRDQLTELVLMFDKEARRGYGNSNRIKIRCVDVDDPELISIFIHEMGHVIDLGEFKGTNLDKISEFKDGGTTLYEDDLSLKFYRISWLSEKIKKDTASDLNFISGYGTTDPFEDFAESFNYYVTHGPAFRELIKTNQSLALKYNFIKTEIFAGKEFFTQENETTPIAINERNYDSTIITYNWQKLLKLGAREDIT